MQKVTQGFDAALTCYLASHCFEEKHFVLYFQFSFHCLIVVDSFFVVIFAIPFKEIGFRFL